MKKRLTWKQKADLGLPLTSQEKLRRRVWRWKQRHGETPAQKRFWARAKEFDRWCAEMNMARPRDRVLTKSGLRQARGYLQQHLSNMQKYQRLLDSPPGTQHTD